MNRKRKRERVVIRPSGLNNALATQDDREVRLFPHIIDL